LTVGVRYLIVDIVSATPESGIRGDYSFAEARLMALYANLRFDHECYDDN